MNPEQEIAALRMFFKWAMEVAFDGCNLDGSDIQDKAIELDLVELRPITPEQSIDGETEHYFLKKSHVASIQAKLEVLVKCVEALKYYADNCSHQPCDCLMARTALAAAKDAGIGGVG